MSKSPKRLGRGLSSLVSDLRNLNPPDDALALPKPSTPGKALTDPAGDLPASAVSRQDPEPSGKRSSAIEARMVDIDSLKPNPLQPRQLMDDDALQVLAASLRMSGMIQPITVRSAAGQLEIVAGERRWRASRLAGFAEVPVIVKDVDESGMLELALIENIHREDLNPVERAQAYRRFCDRFNLSADAVAERVGEDRTTVTNYLRLLDLEEGIRAMLAGGQLSMGHARCIVGVTNSADRMRLAKAVVNHHLSVRALEEIVRREKKGEVREAGKARVAEERSPHIRDVEDQLSRAVGTKVVVQEARRANTGRITIEYYSLDDFDRISAMLGISHM